MKSRLALVLGLSILTACTGMPVALGTRTATAVPQGAARAVSAQGCGFQLLLLIPIEVNSRQERAYQALVAAAGGDYLTDIQVKERWTYAFVGTRYCTILEANAIKVASGGS
jgi:hypothetical protein